MALELLLVAMLAIGQQSPVYLSCELQQRTRRLPVEVAVDEANQRVTIALPTGRTVTRPALFSPTEVKVGDDDMTWWINRLDLSFRRTFQIVPDDPGESGKCKVKPTPPARAF